MEKHELKKKKKTQLLNMAKYDKKKFSHLCKVGIFVSFWFFLVNQKFCKIETETPFADLICKTSLSGTTHSSQLGFVQKNLNITFFFFFCKSWVGSGSRVSG